MKEDFIDVNECRNIIRSSTWVTVHDLQTGAAVDLYECTHDTLITFSNLYLQEKGKCKLKEVKLRMDAPSTITPCDLYLVLFNDSTIAPSVGNELSFPTGYDEDDIVAVIDIPKENWFIYKTYYIEAVVFPDDVVLEGSINDSNLGIDLYAHLYSNQVGSLFPASSTVKIKLVTEVMANGDDE